MFIDSISRLSVIGLLKGCREDKCRYRSKSKKLPISDQKHFEIDELFRTMQEMLQ